MKHILAFVILHAIFASCLYSQKVMIDRVLDTNLFQLKDGTLIKMAGLDVPSTNNPDSTFQELAQRIVKYAEQSFLYGYVNVVFVDSSSQNYDFRYAYISRENAFYSFNYNREYLIRGYGRFTGDVSSIYYDFYKEAEHEAQLKREGIWQYDLSTQNVQLDCSIPIKELSEIEMTQEYYYDRSPDRIFLEIVAGPVTGYVTAIAGAWIATGFGTTTGWDALGPALTGITIGYIVGNSIGVYFVAKGGNKDLSPWLTLLSGVAGTAVGGGIAYLMQYTDYAWIPAVAGITLGPVIYVNLLAPPPERDEAELTYSLPNIRPKYSHKDLYNSTIIFQQEIVRINF